VRHNEEIFARDEAERPRRPGLPRDRARHDVHFVESRAGDEHVGAVDAGAGERLGAGPCPEHELHVERLEACRHLRRVVDDEHFMASGERLGQGEPDLASTDDHDAHGARLYRSVYWPSCSPGFFISFCCC
jgi:hypothetical protein